MTLQKKIDPADITTSPAPTRHWPLGLDGEAAIESRLQADGTLELAAHAGPTTIGRAGLRAPEGDSPGILAIHEPDAAHPGDVHVIAILVEAAFQLFPGMTALHLPDVASKPGLSALAVQTVTDEEAGASAVRIAREHFYQLPLLWHRPEGSRAFPGIRSAIGPQDRLPLLRSPQPTGTFYRRWIPELGTTLSMQAIDRRRDLRLFHGWMNQPRVAFFWELAQSEAELDRYLAGQEADPHIFGVIGSLGDEPSSYFEFYWAKEDRLGPFYDAEDYDRGWHGLIGNPRHLGRTKTGTWFRSVTHCLFLDEPRTQRVVGEPRASHQKMLSYCAETAYDKVKEFDFPHKRAALVCCHRERFFREVTL
ncbi:N(6)-hydroxylysine O-acetyltransferase [Labrys miyagiensis]